jgi:hypothetical protein
MNIVKATRQFEDWLGTHTLLVKKDILIKHVNMKAAIFPFLRATYYRWAQLWPEACPELAGAPRVLAVGDLHVENFGTWRDMEGRLIWGVNDFDEAYEMSYANDLVRLAASAALAAEAGHIVLKGQDSCVAILEGYAKGMQFGGCPFVLGERHTWLRKIAESELRDPVHFWARIDALVATRQKIPGSALKALERLMPARGMTYRIVPRVAGLGSLGHLRLVAIADWHGGQIAREVKALVPSSVSWAEDQTGRAKILYEPIIRAAVRCPDPFVQVRGRWIGRRLSPHCSRIELVALSSPEIELRLLRAMGWETANIHLGTAGARKPILRHLKKQKAKWLHNAATEMVKAVRSDWDTWKKSGYE